MKRQLAFVLAAWMGLQQPLTAVEAYGAPVFKTAETESSQNEWLPVSSPSDGQEQEEEKLPVVTSDAPPSPESCLRLERECSSPAMCRKEHIC